MADSPRPQPGTKASYFCAEGVEFGVTFQRGRGDQILLRDWHRDRYVLHRSDERLFRKYVNDGESVMFAWHGPAKADLRMGDVLYLSCTAKPVRSRDPESR